jgi:hypothetical protein
MEILYVESTFPIKNRGVNHLFNQKKHNFNKFIILLVMYGHIRTEKPLRMFQPTADW